LQRPDEEDELPVCAEADRASHAFDLRWLGWLKLLIDPVIDD
jgi:hypothetical protein